MSTTPGLVAAAVCVAFAVSLFVVLWKLEGKPWWD